MQIVTTAIAESKANNSVSKITEDNLRHLGLSREAVMDALTEACERIESVEGGLDFSGKDVHGETWRVHLQVRS